jgi:hypothetical protein
LLARPSVQTASDSDRTGSPKDRFMVFPLL